jgi:putative cell wall-binding protein
MTRSRFLVLAAAAAACALAMPATPSFAAAPGDVAPPPAVEIAPELVAGVQRIGGADRYIVSAAISADTYPDGVTVNTVYVVSGETYPDALSASALAGLSKSPVLLVKKDSVPEAIRFELSRLRPVRIVVLGGTNSIGIDAEKELRKFAPNFTRVEGDDRYIVSAAASKYALPNPAGTKILYVASGENFPDALSGSAAAGRVVGPVLLVKRDVVPDAVRDEIKRLKPTEIRVLGGDQSISPVTATQLGLIAPVTRIDGADRFAVSASVATPFPNPTDTVYVASGTTFPDALSGGAAAVPNSAPVLLVRADEIPAQIGDQLNRLHPKRIVVLGGTNTVSAMVEAQLKGYLRP